MTIENEAENIAQTIIKKAEQESKEIIDVAIREGEKDGLIRGEKMLRETHKDSERKIITARSLGESEAREKVTKIRSELLEKGFKIFSEKFMKKLTLNKRDYSVFMFNNLENIVREMRTKNYLIMVPIGENSIYEKEIEKVREKIASYKIEIKESEKLEKNFELETVNTKTRKKFSLEDYIQNIENEFLNSITESTGMKKKVISEYLKGFTKKLINDINKDQKNYDKIAITYLENYIIENPSPSYKIIIPKGSLKKFEQNIFKKINAGFRYEVKEIKDVKNGFIIESADTGAKVDFKLESYLMNIRDSVISDLQKQVFN